MNHLSRIVPGELFRHKLSLSAVRVHDVSTSVIVFIVFGLKARRTTATSVPFQESVGAGVPRTQRFQRLFVPPVFF